jgi:transposase
LPQVRQHGIDALGEGKVSTLHEYQPARLVACREVREALRCKCGEGIVTAPGQPNWQEKSRYGVGFVAHVVTTKCADSSQLYGWRRNLRGWDCR